MAGSRGRTKWPIDLPAVVAKLEKGYGRPKFLPVRDPMEELVCCILSQHTTDASSFPAFAKLRETFKTWQDVMDAGAERLAPVIKGAGLYNQKARTILACLREIRERNGGYTLEPIREMPMRDARQWLEQLPGVGPKTASIVLCFAFGMDAIPVDTHVYRVAWRLGFVPEGVGEAKAHDLLLDVVPPELAFRFHVALIQHGRAVCKAPLPKCELCPVTKACRWFAKDGPAKRKVELASARKGAG